MLVTVPLAVRRSSAECAIKPVDGHVDIPSDWTEIAEDAFHSCFEMVSVTIPNTITIIQDDAFHFCRNLESLEIPSSVGKIKDRSFRSCDSLTEVHIPESVKSVGTEAFASCNKLTFLSIAFGVIEIKINAFHNSPVTTLEIGILKNDKWLEDRLGTKTSRNLETLTITEGCEKIEERAVEKFLSLRNVTIADSVQRIDDFAFAGCKKLSSVAIGENSKLQKIGKSAFMDSTLESVFLPKNLKDIGNLAFSRVKHANIGTEVIPPVFRRAFSSDLETVTLTNTVTKIRETAFQRLKGLRQLVVGASLEEIGHMAFAYCRKLKKVDLRPAVVKTIGRSAFFENYALEEVHFGYHLELIDQAAFYNCSIRNSIIFPPAIKSIGSIAFVYNKITSIRLPEPTNGTLSVYKGAFSDCYSVQSVYIDARRLYLEESAFSDMKGLSTDRVYINKDLRGVIFGTNHFINIQCPISTTAGSAGDELNPCYCLAGYGNNVETPPSDSIYYRCLPCTKGTFNLGSNVNLCEDCRPGTYADVPGLSGCRNCPSGRYSGVTKAKSQAVCENCPNGTYMSLSGASSCTSCPAGTFCNITGMSIYNLCLPGQYQRLTGRSQCDDCPSGSYQNETGQSFCHTCRAGYASDQGGAKNETTCAPCIAGKYTANEGTGECPSCPEGQYQPDPGQTKCIPCPEAGDTSNEDFTSCVVDERLLSDSLISLIFTDGVALYGTFSLTFGFIAVVAGAYFLKEKHPDDLAQLSKFQTFTKSFLAGSTWGSELFLIAGLFEDSPDYAIAMLCLRLLHFVCGAIVLYGMLGKKGTFRDRINKRLVHHSHEEKGLPDMLNHDFLRENIPVVNLLMLLTMCDCTIVQFMPWRKSHMYSQSKGFATKGLMKFVLGTKTIQCILSTVVQIAYLASTDDAEPTTNVEAQALFGLNIAFSVTSVIFSTLSYLLRLKLKNAKKKSAQGENSKVEETPKGTGKKEESEKREESKKKEEAKQNGETEEKVVRRSVVVELTEVFQEPSEEVRYTQNPLIASHPSSNVEML